MGQKNPYLVRTIEERQAKTAVMQKLTDDAAKDDRDLSADERKTFDELVERINALDKEIERISAADSAAAQFLKMIGSQKEAEEKADRAHADATPDDNGDEGQTEHRADYGRQFVESTAFQSYTGAGRSAAVDFPGVASPEFRAAIRTDTWEKIPEPFKWSGPPQPNDRNPFLDVLGRVQVGSGAITYMRWGNASEAAKVAEGELKQEADLALTEGATTLETFAHWKAITRQALEDISQIQSILQNKLLSGVRKALESDAASVYNADDTIERVAETDIVRAIRKALGIVEGNGYSANAVLMNPADAADFDLQVMAGTVAGPVRAGNPFGLSVVTSKTQPAGSVGVADFKSAITWFDRNVLSSYLTDSHADYFLRNQLVLLAETRAKFVVTEPQAAAIGDFAGGGGETVPAG